MLASCPSFTTIVRRRRAVRLFAWYFMVGTAATTSACQIFEPDPNTPRTAGVIWQAPIAAMGPPAIDDSSVYFALRDHSIAAVNRATGDVRWVTYTGEWGELNTQYHPVRSASVVVFGDEYLFGLDPANGNIRWVFGRTGGVEPRVGVYQFATDGARIYAGSVTGAVFGIDEATGTQVWRTDLLPDVAKQARVVAVGNGLVYVNFRYGPLPYAGRVYALSSATGSIAWSYELPRESGSVNATGDGLLMQDAPAGPTFAVTFDDGRIVGLDALAGSVRWTLPGLSDFELPIDFRRLTASRGTLVASESGPDQLTAYDLETGEQRWSVYLTDQGSASAGFDALSSDADLAYVMYTNGVVGAYDLDTGERLWVRKAPKGFFVHAPTISADTFFIAAYEAAYAIRR